MSYRTDHPVDLTVETHLSPADCLEAVEYIARQARPFGIPLRIEVRRSPTGRPDDRHQVTARRGSKASWVMALELAPLGEGDDDGTRVVLRLERYRRRLGYLADTDAAATFTDLVRQALRAAARPRRAVEGNVIPLHAYAPLGRLAS